MTDNAPEPDNDDLEPYCHACGATIGIFIDHGDDWHHFHGAGTAANPNVIDETDHEAVVAWRDPGGK